MGGEPPPPFGPSSAYGDAFAIDSLLFESAESIPEPASRLLFGTGLAVLRAWRKRKP
jgi:hypothetical protein